MATIQDCMSDRVFSCHPDTPLPEVAEIMWDKDCGFVPVTNASDDRIEGVITDRDVCMAAYSKGRPLAQILTGDVMTRAVHQCQPDDDVSVAHDLMREHQVRRLPITDGDGHVLGVLSLNDLAVRARESKDRKGRNAVAETLGEVSRHRLPVAPSASV